MSRQKNGPLTSNGRTLCPHCCAPMKMDDLGGGGGDPVGQVDAYMKVEVSGREGSFLDGSFSKVRWYRCPNDTTHDIKTVESLRHSRGALLVRKRHHEKGQDRPFEPFSFDDLLESIALADAKKSDPRDHFYLADKVARVLVDGLTPGQTTIESNHIGKLVLRVLKNEGRIPMWIRYSLIFRGLDRKGAVFESVIEGLNQYWGDKKP